MHSISNRNFEIHIFALLTFRGKSQDVTAARRRLMIPWRRSSTAIPRSSVSSPLRPEQRLLLRGCEAEGARARLDMRVGTASKGSTATGQRAHFPSSSHSLSP
jgi:hypothetical protein